MNARDVAIVKDLERFRCLSRDDIAELHFTNVKNAINEANKVLLRLRRDGVIGVSKERRKYIYFPDRSIKKDSSKIGHFLAIAEFYREIRKHEAPTMFEVEPKLGSKGLPEPDVFTTWKRTPFFVEIQNSRFSSSVMQAKMKRYEAYYASGIWEQASWQPPQGKKLFPFVWIIGEGRYDVGKPSFKVLQGTVEQIISMYKKTQ
ncbi:replication-relaxation family protein [Paenibacillus sp. sgz302251]|uniref:replication-relaxation family protein n=1 Tax=Paenibacillus sp. sgz302251 TaxID=3414493 RepID=UPI003C7B6884